MKVVAEIAYVKKQRIGEGEGMNSEVFLANDPQLNGEVVIKEVPKDKFFNLPSYFVEAHAMFQSAHENIVPIYYACETADHVCLAMPYYENGSLAKRIENSSLPLADVIKLGQGVLNGVAQIHLAKFVHFDIKPSNVLYSDIDVPMVADFGQARAVNANGVVEEAPPLYHFVRPPETFQGGVGLPQGDIFQVGLLLYRAACGEPHYGAQLPQNMVELTSRVLSGKFPARDKFMPHVPRRLKTVIRKALKVDPAERYATALEFADALSGVDIELNWWAQWLPNDEIRWQTNRPGQPSLIVELLADSSDWKVEIYTRAHGAQRRAKNRSDWRRGLSRADAFIHLKTVFEALAA